MEHVLSGKGNSTYRIIGGNSSEKRSFYKQRPLKVQQGLITPTQFHSVFSWKIGCVLNKSPTFCVESPPWRGVIDLPSKTINNFIQKANSMKIPLVARPAWTQAFHNTSKRHQWLLGVKRFWKTKQNETFERESNFYVDIAGYQLTHISLNSATIPGWLADFPDILHVVTSTLNSKISNSQHCLHHN